MLKKNRFIHWFMGAGLAVIALFASSFQMRDIPGKNFKWGNGTFSEIDQIIPSGEAPTPISFEQNRFKGKNGSLVSYNQNSFSIAKGGQYQIGWTIDFSSPQGANPIFSIHLFNVTNSQNLDPSPIQTQTNPLDNSICSMRGQTTVTIPDNAVLQFIATSSSADVTLHSRALFFAPVVTSAQGGQ